MSKDDAYLLEMLSAARRAQSFRGQGDEAEFLANAMFQDAVMLQFLVIGENANKVSLPFREAHPNIPWAKMYGMRNLIAHAYGQVDLGRIWAALCEGIPTLLHELEPLVPPDDGIEPATKLTPREDEGQSVPAT